MNHIRKITAVILAVMMLLPMGCADQSAGEDGALDIVCTIFPQYDLARSIAGDTKGVNIKMLMGAGQESHDYDPSSKDIAAIHGCDIFVYTGGESDSWIRDLLEGVDTENKTVISLMDIVDPMESETVEGMESEDHDHGAIDHVEYDEHVWTSPKNAKIIADAIAEAMCLRMPEAAESFRRNRDSLAGRLDSLDQSFTELAASVESPTIIVADRFPLLYFCKEYGIGYFAAFAGCAASTEPSSKTVQFLIEKVKDEGIPAVFKMDLSSGNVADTVAEATGATVLTFYSCHTLSSADFEAGETYVSMMEKNLAALRTALGAEA